MTTYRVNKNKDYFVASNIPFNDPRLSWEARGVMGYLLSKPDGWECRNHDLVAQSKAGEYVIKRIMKELQEFGYIHRTRISQGKGNIQWVTEVYESPEMNPHFSTGDFSTGEKPPIENDELSKGDFSTIEFSTGEKPPHIVNTDLVSTDSVNTDLKNSSGSSTHTHASAQTNGHTPAHETQSVPESEPTQEHPPPPHLNPDYTDPKSEYRATPPSQGESPAFEAVVELWKGDNLGVISRTIERELWEAMVDIEMHLSKHGVSGVGESAQAWLEYALKETAKQPKASWRYTETILANIEESGSLARHIADHQQVKTQQAENGNRSHRSRSSPAKTVQQLVQQNAKPVTGEF